jgi:O-antigen/teichoic acid export membrane protein
MKQLLLKSTIFRFIERAIVIITSLLLTPYLISELGSSNYGLWILILSIMGWFNVIDLGFPQAVQRQIIQALELKDNHRVNVIFSTGLLLFALLGLFSVVILMALTQVPAIFGVYGPDQITLVHILLVLSIKIFWGFLMNPFHGFFSGLLRFDIDANLSSLNAIVKALLVFWLISDLNIWGAVVATLLADIITNILKVIYAKRIFPSLYFKINLVSLQEIKSLFSYSKHLVLNGIISTIGSKSSPLLITQLFDLPSLAIQRIAANLVMHAQALVGTITGVFSPVYNKMVAKNTDMERIFIQTTTITMFSSTVINTSLLAFGKVFIMLWVGDEFEYAIFILYVAVFTTTCSGFSSTANSILLAQANHKLLSAVSFGIVVFSLCLSIMLGIKFGLIGVSIGAAITSLFFNVFIKMRLFKYYNKYNTSEVYKRLLKSVFISFSLGYIGLQVLEWLHVDTWFELVLAGFLTFPFILIICWALLLNKELKILLFNLLAERLKLEKRLT